MGHASDVIVYSVIGIVTVILNTIEIVLIKRTKSKLKTYQQLLLSLAISDLLVGLTSVINSILAARVSTQLSRQVFTFMVIYSFTASVINLFIIGVDRLVAVRYPLKHVIWVRKGTIIKAAIYSWIFLGIEVIAFTSIGIAIPSSMHGPVLFYLWALPIIIIGSTIVFLILYGCICYFAMHAQSKAERILNDDINARGKRQLSSTNIAYIATTKKEEAHIKKGIFHEIPSGHTSAMKLQSIFTSNALQAEEINQAVDQEQQMALDKDPSGPSPQANLQPSKEVKKTKPVCRYCKKQRALVITCSMVVCSFFVCTLPFAIETLASTSQRFEVLLVVNSLCNPLVYFFKGLWGEKRLRSSKKKNHIQVAPNSVSCQCAKLKDVKNC
ncbi:cholecystokinin receptor-like [Rhopilema esculentum]|uniref:cholecystokinin receptor-like n=1 Tax=Rhopilema esculentum TaxID=499914 RepID=UPI0031D772AB